MGLFDKKYCDVCGEKIGLLGNRKLEDGNLCKNCAKKLSPWFEERRHSTVAEIKQQLQYREENRTRVSQFLTTREMGENWRVLLDDTHRWLLVTRVRDWAEENPDVLDFSQVTGCRMDIDEDRTELKRKDADGNSVSYNPPRYSYSYDFDLKITVNSPYFDDMHFRLNSSPVEMVSEAPLRFLTTQSFDPSYNVSYRQYAQMGNEICETLKNLGKEQTDAAPAVSSAPSAPAADNGPWVCPACGAEGNGKFCEFCGTARP